MDKSVFIITGPPASGKTTEMKNYANDNGIYLCVPHWEALKIRPQSYWRYLQNDRLGKSHLFIEGYDLQDAASNLFLDELAGMNITIVATSQHELTLDERAKLPASFQIVKCDFVTDKEVLYG